MASLKDPSATIKEILDIFGRDNDAATFDYEKSKAEQVDVEHMTAARRVVESWVRMYGKYLFFVSLLLAVFGILWVSFAIALENIGTGYKMYLMFIPLTMNIIGNIGIGLVVWLSPKSASGWVKNAILLWYGVNAAVMVFFALGTVKAWETFRVCAANNWTAVPSDTETLGVFSTSRKLCGQYGLVLSQALFATFAIVLTIPQPIFAYFLSGNMTNLILLVSRLGIAKYFSWFVMLDEKEREIIDKIYKGTMDIANSGLDKAKQSFLANHMHRIGKRYKKFENTHKYDGSTLRNHPHKFINHAGFSLPGQSLTNGPLSAN
jgi:hypothetical protein